MSDNSQRFNVAAFHGTGELIGTHVSTNLGGRNIVQKHFEINHVDKKLTNYLNNKGWGIAHDPTNRPGPQGPSSSKRSPS